MRIIPPPILLSFIDTYLVYGVLGAENVSYPFEKRGTLSLKYLSLSCDTLLKTNKLTAKNDV